MTSFSSEKKRESVFSLLLFVALFSFYGLVAWLARGGDEWWHVDIASGGNVLWGDDAYRYFIARLAFVSSDVYFFNFALPLSVFFDGFVVLAEGQFFPRLIKASFLSVSAVFSYFACRVYCQRWLSVVCVLTVYMLPLFFFVGISFFGESWFVILTSFFVFCAVKEKYFCAALVVGLLPLFRIEGVFFVLAFSVFLLLIKERRYSIIPFLPGAVYFFAVVIMGPGLGLFVSWRNEMSNVYALAGEWYRFDSMRLFASLNFFLIVFVFFGYLLERRYLFIFVPSVFIVVFFVVLSANERSNFEPRYLTMAMPAIPLGLAIFFGWFMKLKGKGVWLPWFQYLPFVFFVVFFFFNLNSIHVANQIVKHVASNGAFPEEVTSNPFSLDTYFRKMSRSDIANYSELATAIHAAVAENEKIEHLIVSHFLVFYFLDAEKLDGRVMPVFALFGRGRLDGMLGQSLSAGYFHSQPYFSYFSLRYPYHSDPLILYVDNIPIDGYPLRWLVGGHQIAILAGERVTKEQSGDLLHKDIELP